jgi:hypothetical protein
MNSPQALNKQKTVNVLFLGQCLQYGYPGVDDSETFPHVAKETLSRRFPHLTFNFNLKYLYHPVGLKPILAHRLMMSNPDFVIISVSAIFVASSWRVSYIYEIAPEVLDTARSFLQKVEAKMRREDFRSPKTALDNLFTRRAPLSIEEYRNYLREGIETCRNANQPSVVLMGPSHFDEDTHEGYPLESPDIWLSVNKMALELGEEMKVSVIDTQGLLLDCGRETLLPNSIKYSRYGHQMVALEVDRVLGTMVASLDAVDS